MKIAVTYQEGKIFQHFGKTQFFRIFETDHGEILSDRVIGTEGAGHEALADFLAKQGVSAVICGGLGGGAQAALAGAGISVYSGAEGDPEAAVRALLEGKLENKGVNCDHHEEEAAHGCGGHCGNCAGCHSAPAIEGKNVGKVCKTHYRGTFNDGTEFDSSFSRGEPMEFVCGVGMMIRGFDEAVAKMEIGQEVDIHLMPEEAYGLPNPEMIFAASIAKLPGSESLSVGDRVMLYDTNNRPFQARVAAKTEETVTFDANHEMAGKELNFHIQLLAVQ